MDEKRATVSVIQDMGKRVKPKFPKVKRKGTNVMGLEKSEDVGEVQGIEHLQKFEKEGITEVNQHHKRDKKKKRDGKDDRTCIENCQANSAKLVDRKKRKRREKRSKDDERIRQHVTDNGNRGELLSRPICEGQNNELFGKTERKMKKRGRKEGCEDNQSSVHQENVAENSDANVKSTKCNRMGLERRKKDEKKKRHKDGLLGAHPVSADNGNNDLWHRNEKQNNEALCGSGGKEKTDVFGESRSDGMRNSEVGFAKKKKKKKMKLEESVPNDVQENELSTNKKKRKKIRLVQNDSGDMQDDNLESIDKGEKETTKLMEHGSNNQTPKKSNRKVRFSDQDEVFPLPADLNNETGKDDEDKLVRGKRFTREEDEIVKEAVFRYIEEHDLGEEGLDMVLNCSKHRELKGCWREIGSSIPYRPYVSIYYRAQVLFRRSESRKWTQEEYEQILKYQEEHGNDWKTLADELGKHRFHVKDTWRRIKLTNMNKGHWSQEEYQKLFDLVNADLQLKVLEEKKSKHGMLRDNICWTSISDELSTRPQATCCIKWYKQLTSPMVAEGLWADVDDYHLLGALYSLDATCLEDVDWDYLLDSRSGDVCRKRWNQMVLHIGQHGNKSFAEQVEVLAQRYCPHLLEARESWDNKPRVP